MIISLIKRNVIYSLIIFGSESKPKPLAAQGDRKRCEASLVGSFQPNERFRLDIFRLDVIFTE